jgi:hypothetical protein
VWAPLGESVLRVDDGDGQTLAVELLSRGAREQLFLSLRLALVAMFARRGATLPLVLDDILVNFDTRRARAAAVVLRDFAAQGHQLLVFTCHEHILKLFRSIKAAVERLPERTAPHVAPLAEEPAPQAEPEPTTPTSRRVRPAARKRRTEVVVVGRKDFDTALLAAPSRVRGLRRIDPPEETPPEPPTARVMVEQDEIELHPDDNLWAELATDADEHEL